MRELDVRPILRAGGEPFGDIMKFVDDLHPNEAFRLLATFKPEPLLTVMAHKGCRGEAKQVAEEDWAVVFTPVD